MSHRCHQSGDGARAQSEVLSPKTRKRGESLGGSWATAETRCSEALRGGKACEMSPVSSRGRPGGRTLAVCRPAAFSEYRQVPTLSASQAARHIPVAPGLTEGIDGEGGREAVRHSKAASPDT